MSQKCCPELAEGQSLHKSIIRIYSDNGKEIGIPILNEWEFGVYILLCNDKNFYIGYSSNIHERFARHLKGSASVHTKRYKSFKLIYCEVYPNEKLAVQRERQLKGWSRKKKNFLIKGKTKNI
jgi:putative endonuclease